MDEQGADELDTLLEQVHHRDSFFAFVHALNRDRAAAVAAEARNPPVSRLVCGCWRVVQLQHRRLSRGGRCVGRGYGNGCVAGTAAGAFLESVRAVPLPGQEL